MILTILKLYKIRKSNMPAHYESSVPGSVMLLGEYAVLNGHRGLACAVNQRIKGKLIPHASDSIKIFSDRFGTYQASIHEVLITKPFDFILTAIQRYQHLLSNGFDLIIESDFSDQVGLGSSAAVTVTTLALLKSWLQPSRFWDSKSFFEECLAVVHKVQKGVGSGADIAASIWGGIISIKTSPLNIEKLEGKLLPLVLLYSGSKTSTVTLIEEVLTRKTKHPKLVSDILQAIGDCSDIGYESILSEDIDQMAEVFVIQQSLLKALHVSNNHLDNIIKVLEEDPGIIASKISGSGLGDCIISLGQLKNPDVWQDSCWKQQGVMPIPVEITEQGLVWK
jgi:mevalonate kinase